MYGRSRARTPQPIGRGRSIRGLARKSTARKVSGEELGATASTSSPASSATAGRELVSVEYATASKLAGSTLLPLKLADGVVIRLADGHRAHARELPWVEMAISRVSVSAAWRWPSPPAMVAPAW
jgi:hypothetical protein